MLTNYLINAGLVTGPIAGTNTSNSSMGATKTFLLGLPQFQGDEKYLIFGRVLHEHLQFIEDLKYVSPDLQTLQPDEQKWLYGCLKAARENPVVKRLLMKTSREQKLYTEIDGVKLALILDLEQEHENTGSDWKSTSCGSMPSFIEKALLYDYIRQSLLYKKARKLKHFYFIGLQKRPPHNVYIMDVKRYQAEEVYAAQELKFLLYFFKHYGKIFKAGQTVNPGKEITATQNKVIMAIQTKGKEALAAIAAHYKEVKASAKLHASNVKKLNGMIEKFPKKEKELYADKLAKFNLED